MPRHNQPKRKAQGHKTRPKTEEVIRFSKPPVKNAPIRVGQTIEDWKASLRS